MKKLFRILGLIILTPLCIYWIVLGGFHIKEYAKGNAYVTYLEEHKTIWDDTFELDAEFYDHQLFLVGEIHGFAKSPELDFQLFKHINQKTEVRYYMAEVDYSQAYFLNKYLETGDDSILHKALENWLVVQARNNKDYYQKWKNLFVYNQTLALDKRITVIGCDVLTDFQLAIAHLKEILGEVDYNRVFGTIKTLKGLVLAANFYKNNDRLKEYLRTNRADVVSDLEHMIHTLIQTEKKGREDKIFTNFKRINDLYGLENQKIYAFYGLFHTLQSPLANGFEPLAAKIKKSILPHGASMVSLNTCFQDSEMIMPSNALPSFLQTGPKWSEVSFKYDSLLLFYLEGIKDLMRTSKKDTITFYKMDAVGSPYFKTDRLMKVTTLLPLLKDQTFEIDANLGTSDYAQYLIFIRNSKAAQPFLE